MDDTLFAQLITAAPPLWGYQTRALKGMWDGEKNQRGCRIASDTNFNSWHDMSGNGNDLPHYNSNNVGILKHSVQFVGNTSYGIATDSALGAGTPWTMEICLRGLDTSTAANTVFRMGSANSANRDIFFKATRTKIGHGTWGSITWTTVSEGVHTASLVADATVQRFYIDGTLVKTLTRSYVGTGKFLWLGASYNASSGFEGLIFNARVYQSALPDADIARNYRIDRARFRSGT